MKQIEGPFELKKSSTSVISKKLKAALKFKEIKSSLDFKDKPDPVRDGRGHAGR